MRGLPLGKPFHAVESASRDKVWRSAVTSNVICLASGKEGQRLSFRRNKKQMTALARIKFVILGWAATTVFFTAVLEISELGHKPLGLAVYANAVHFALLGTYPADFRTIYSALPAEATKTNLTALARSQQTNISTPEIALRCLFTYESRNVDGSPLY